MYETMAGLEQGVVIHSNVLFQELKACAERGAPGVCEWNRTTSAVTPGSLWCGCVGPQAFQAAWGATRGGGRPYELIVA